MGARPVRIASLLSGEVLLLTGSGVAVVSAPTPAAAVWIRTVSMTFIPGAMVVASVVVLVGLVAAIAAAPATLRAVRIDPARALRAE